MCQIQVPTSAVRAHVARKFAQPAPGNRSLDFPAGADSRPAARYPIAVSERLDFPEDACRRWAQNTFGRQQSSMQRSSKAGGSEEPGNARGRPVALPWGLRPNPDLDSHGDCSDLTGRGFRSGRLRSSLNKLPTLGARRPLPMRSSLCREPATRIGRETSGHQVSLVGYRHADAGHRFLHRLNRALGGGMLKLTGGRFELPASSPGTHDSGVSGGPGRS